MDADAIGCGIVLGTFSTDSVVGNVVDNGPDTDVDDNDGGGRALVEAGCLCFLPGTSGLNSRLRSGDLDGEVTALKYVTRLRYLGTELPGGEGIPLEPSSC